VTFLLDTMVVSYFLQAAREDELAAAAACCPMAIVDEVRQELENDSNRGGRPFETWLATSGIEMHTIVVGSAESATLAQLLSVASPNRSRGERASIAVAESDMSLTFVTNDRGALWIAIREFWMPGERILGLAVFLRRLFEQAALSDPAILDEIMTVASAQRPTWWATWRSGVARHGVAAMSPLVSAPPTPSVDPTPGDDE